MHYKVPFYISLHHSKKTHIKQNQKPEHTTMKTLLIIAIIATTIFAGNKTEAVAMAGLEGKKFELSLKKGLLRLYNPRAKTTEVVVPKESDYELQQVAVIENGYNADEPDALEYLAVYKHTQNNSLKLVLYNTQNQVQLTLDSVQTIHFESCDDNSRILLERTGPNGQLEPEALLVPGCIQLAQ